MRAFSNLLVMALFLFATVSSYSQSGSHHPRHVPANGFVPNSAVAIQIAEAVLVPIFGKEAIESERPFRAVLKGDTWYVYGTVSEDSVGGAAVVQISKKTGCILDVAHPR